MKRWLLMLCFLLLAVPAWATVNAVTAEPQKIVQDYALVISCGDGSNTNGITVTPAPAGLVSSTTPLVASVPAMTAIGTVFFGFSTAPVLAQADSSPRNAHSVTAIDADRPCRSV